MSGNPHNHASQANALERNASRQTRLIGSRIRGRLTWTEIKIRRIAPLCSLHFTPFHPSLSSLSTESPPSQTPRVYPLEDLLPIHSIPIIILIRTQARPIQALHFIGDRWHPREAKAKVELLGDDQGPPATLDTSREDSPIIGRSVPLLL